MGQVLSQDQLNDLKHSECLLSTAYLAPVEYYQVMVNSRAVKIELCENYIKQSYRNRCRILAANGILSLSVPVSAPNHTLVKDVLIDYTEDWQNQHWRSITSAYGSSPYFIYYDYQLEPFFKKKHKFLIDLNNSLQEKILELIKIKLQINHTSSYQMQVTEEFDFRNKIHPKKEPLIATEEYYQVFSDKYPFSENLSILDLLFNKGPEALSFLKI
jgi:hypothetical protein